MADSADLHRLVAGAFTVGAILASGLLMPSSPVGATGDQIPPGATQCFRVDGEPGDVAIVNLTPVEATARGWGVLESSEATGDATAASVNYAVGSIDPNVAMAEVGPTGSVCFRNSDRASVHLVADQLGSVSADVFKPAAAGSSLRILDSRTDEIVPPGGRVCADAEGDVGDVAFVNLTPVDATGRGNGLLVSSDVVTAPVAASVNYDAGAVNPNLSVAEIGSDGQVCFVNAPHAAVHVVMDQIGAVDSAAINMAGFDGSPVRVLDTRDDVIVAPSGRVCTRVSGFSGDVAMVNITPVAATGRGNGLLVTSDIDETPVAANVNFSVGSVDPNVAFAPIGSDGQVCFVNSDHASVHVVIDQLATLDSDRFDWWSGLTTPVRVFDTRVDAPVFPPPAETVTQGGFVWAVVLAGSDDITDPVLAAAIDDARRAGYSTGPTDCDVGAAEALGMPAGTLTISVYLENEDDADLAQASFAILGVDGVVAEVQTFCLD